MPEFIIAQRRSVRKLEINLKTFKINIDITHEKEYIIGVREIQKAPKGDQDENNR